MRLLSWLFTAALVLGAVVVVFAGSPVPERWNPAAPLKVSDPVTPLTQWKLRRALRTPESCLAALEPFDVQSMEPLVESEQCGINPRVSVSGVGAAVVSPVQTTCAIALRLAMWDRHSIQPAAQRHFGMGVFRISHQSSYNCREIRTPQGSGGRMSTHATAEAIDISGFVLSDGRQIGLFKDWDSSDPRVRAFFREVRDGACRWFVTALGPEYNALHRDHFHLQSRGWGLCR